jgi:hypothetical protein
MKLAYTKSAKTIWLKLQVLKKKISAYYKFNDRYLKYFTDLDKVL